MIFRPYITLEIDLELYTPAWLPYQMLPRLTVSWRCAAKITTPEHVTPRREREYVYRKSRAFTLFFNIIFIFNRRSVTGGRTMNYDARDQVRVSRCADWVVLARLHFLNCPRDRKWIILLALLFGPLHTDQWSINGFENFLIY